MAVEVTGETPGITVEGSGSSVTVRVVTGGGSSDVSSARLLPTPLGDPGQIPAVNSEGDATEWVDQPEGGSGLGVLDLFALYTGNQDIGAFSGPPYPAGLKIGFTGQSTPSQNGYYLTDGSGGLQETRTEFVTLANLGLAVSVQVTNEDIEVAFGELAEHLDENSLTSGYATDWVVTTEDGMTALLKPKRTAFRGLRDEIGRTLPTVPNDYFIDYDATDGGVFQCTLNHQVVVFDATGGDIECRLGPHATIVRPVDITNRGESGVVTIVNMPGDGVDFEWDLLPGQRVKIAPDQSNWTAWEQAPTLAYTAANAGKVWTATEDGMALADAPSGEAGEQLDLPPLGPVRPAITLPGHRFGNRSVLQWSGNRRRDYYPFTVANAVTVTALRAYISSAAASGSQVLLGLYEIDDDLVPGDRLAASGVLAGTSTGALRYELPSPITLEPGRYATALNANVSTVSPGPTMLGLEAGNPWPANDQLQAVTDWRVPSAAFTMPDPADGTPVTAAATNRTFDIYCFLEISGYAA